MNLYEIWITWCQIIHTLISDGTSIEQKIDLQREARRVVVTLSAPMHPINIEEASTA